jgi:hypothetical protein
MKSVFRLAARRTGLSEGATQSRAAPVSEKRNEERFSLGGAAHWPLRGGDAVAGRAGERKTYWGFSSPTCRK